MFLESDTKKIHVCYFCYMCTVSRYIICLIVCTCDIDEKTIEEASAYESLATGNGVSIVIS